MNCSHPVLYMINGELVCHVCGAVIDAPGKAEPAKESAKRKGKVEKAK